MVKYALSPWNHAVFHVKLQYRIYHSKKFAHVTNAGFSYRIASDRLLPSIILILHGQATLQKHNKATEGQVRGFCFV
jgi:hypothetical protein